jgi:hypothetical protein
MVGTTVPLIIMVTTIMATRGTASMSITNFENMIMANLNIMVEDLSTMVEGPITLNILGMVAGMSRVTAANTELALYNTTGQ